MEDFGLILKSLCGRGFETHLISADLVHRPQSWIIPSKVPPLAQPLALVREISVQGATPCATPGTESCSFRSRDHPSSRDTLGF